MAVSLENNKFETLGEKLCNFKMSAKTFFFSSLVLVFLLLIVTIYCISSTNIHLMSYCLPYCHDASILSASLYCQLILCQLLTVMSECVINIFFIRSVKILLISFRLVFNVSFLGHC